MRIVELPNTKRFWNIAFLTLITLAFFVRVYKLEEYPLSVNQDELSNIYDGYSASLSNSNPHALRTYGASILFPFFSAAGFLFLYEKIKIKWLRYSYVSVALTSILFNAAHFLNRYSNDLWLRDNCQQNTLVEVCKKINTLKEKYDRIYIEDAWIQSYIYMAGYCGITPARFQSCYKNVDTQNWDGLFRLINTIF